MQFVEIDHVRAQPFERRDAALTDEGGIPTLRTFRVVALVVRDRDVVAELRPDRDLVATAGKRLAQPRLPDTGAVGIGCVEEGDPTVDGVVDEATRLGGVDLAQPVETERPGAESDLGNLDAGRPERTFGDHQPIL